MSLNRGIRIFLATSVAAIGVAGAQAPTAPPATPSAPAVVPRSLDVPGGALVAPGPAPDLALLYTGDVIGYIDPCG